jgi:hypothetical protein
MKKFLPLIIALIFLALAGVLHFWIAPFLELLPTGYSNTLLLSVDDQFRYSPTGDWQINTLNATRNDETITNTGQIAIIEGALHVYFSSGAVNFESTSLYGVDRRSRENLAGYGTSDRSGQYLFPIHIEQKTYSLWDPMFIGLRKVVFDHSENFKGFQVYVFKFSVTGLDETAGYNFLPNVPGLYRTFTDGEGTLWIEPVSGIVVNYLDRGTSYFVDSTSGMRISNGEFHRWSNLYTPDTVNSQLAQAKKERLTILALEVWTPAGLFLIGLIFAGFFFVQRRKKTSD